MPAVSIIVPVYNVEKYLRKCLDSILKQTFHDWELILIDDGSMDRSADICKEYLGKNDRIKYFFQENGGLGHARNQGVRKAMGKYILFVDSDDFIAENMIEVLYNNIVKSDADVASCGIYNVFSQKCVAQCEQIEQFECSAEEAFKLLLIGKKIPGSSCNKLFRAELLDKVKFPEGVLYEDVWFHTELIQNIKKVYVDTTPLYYYVHRADSITTRKYDSAAMAFIEAYEDTYRIVREKYPNIVREARFKLLWAYFSILDRMLQEKKYWEIDEYKKVKNYLKRNVLWIVKDNYFRKSRKIAAIALFVNVRLYAVLMKINNKMNKGIIS
ncbi:glycosyltransferase family 2 protein [Faecalicatena contorta]|uniref:glycosyltransferase family 2 protein n=1 Tax=Faecalicatena contorta TaxID=39482 RepID=UPI001F31D079|nr:glycosyltransferase family 2 protein [Faecalicatena contorta]MCF2555219.1 glycosyltransferase family 2 protein [Faecalicatena contorta]